jgi:hypothetical protein
MSKRRVVGFMVHAARVFGLLLITLAIFSLPVMRPLTGHLSVSLTLMSSLALAFVGVLWLIALQVFLKFFDQFLSRN